MLTNLDEKATEVAAEVPATLVGSHEQPVEVTPPPPTPPRQRRLRLSRFEKLAAGRLVNGDPESVGHIHAEVLAWAEALNDPAGRDEVRHLLISKSLAASRVKLLYLEALRDEHLRRGEVDECRLTQRVLDSETRRFGMLLAEHRLNCATASGTRSVTVSVGAVQGNVNIAAGSGAQ